MGKIFCVMGKSASGKDTIYNKILQDDSLMLSRIIPYTTRPIRDGETQDKDYHFCNEEDVKRLSAQGRIIELREYNTVSLPDALFPITQKIFPICKPLIF